MLLTHPFSAVDIERMSRAIQIARKGLYTCMPNPRVGCVLDKAGTIVGEGWHHNTGEGHAEVNALHQAGVDAIGATAYVTLEPCSHYGKTPPCAKTLIDAGVSRVVVGMTDPNPEVAGRGIALLREAGVTVDTGLMTNEVRTLNPGFIRRMETGLPFIRCKMAMSLDGRTAMASGESQWITGPDARADVQRLRGQSCAIVTGVGTVLEDDPSLTFRHKESGLSPDPVLSLRQPLRVILDSCLRTPPDARIFTHSGNVLIICGDISSQQRDRFLERVLAFRNACHINDSHINDHNAHSENITEVIELPDIDGQIDLSAVWQLLGQRECNEILLETGATLAGSAVEAQYIDELWIYMASVLMGSSARPLFALPLDSMAEKYFLTLNDVRAIGKDWRFIATFDYK